MAEINQNEYIDTSEFLEPEDSMEISSDFTDITPIKKTVIIKERNECECFRARRYGQWWTLKCVSKKVVDKSRVYEYLRKEFVVGISLWHPNIVRMISIQSDLVDGEPGIVLEYVDGVTLGEFLDTNPSLEERIKIADQMISAMRYYMGKQVVHCDLKPANILITHNGHNVKLIDFGLADVDNSNIFKGHAGTDRYAAPEQKRSDGVVDCRSDIYAFGHLLKLLHLPVMFRHVIRRCLKEKQSDRYQNPVDLYLDFEKAKAFRVSKWAITTLVAGCADCCRVICVGQLDFRKHPESRAICIARKDYRWENAGDVFRRQCDRYQGFSPSVCGSQCSHTVFPSQFSVHTFRHQHRFGCGFGSECEVGSV